MLFPGCGWEGYDYENVVYSVAHTDISHAIRLSSVWPINFQHHRQAAATGTFRSDTSVQRNRK